MPMLSPTAIATSKLIRNGKSLTDVVRIVIYNKNSLINISYLFNYFKIIFFYLCYNQAINILNLNYESSSSS